MGGGAPGRAGKSVGGGARREGEGNAAAAAGLMEAGGTPETFDAADEPAAGFFLEERCGLGSSVTAARGAQRLAMAEIGQATQQKSSVQSLEKPKGVSSGNRKLYSGVISRHFTTAMPWLCHSQPKARD
jgi:hypothetical protein